MFNEISIAISLISSISAFICGNFVWSNKSFPNVLISNVTCALCSFSASLIHSPKASAVACSPLIPAPAKSPPAMLIFLNVESLFMISSVTPSSRLKSPTMRFISPLMPFAKDNPMAKSINVLILFSPPLL